MTPLASFLFVAVIILGVSSRCPPYWTYFQGNCYRYGDSVISWPEAQFICHTRGAKLAEVSSPQENKFLKSMAKKKRGKKNGFCAYCVWLGGNDIFKEGTWEWASTSKTFKGVKNWANGEPNNVGDDEDCLNLFSWNNYGWTDGPCTAGCNFICSTLSNEINVVIDK